MLAKGLDLPAVTLVGVISADIGLHLPDFRAGERTFQLADAGGGPGGAPGGRRPPRARHHPDVHAGPLRDHRRGPARFRFVFRA